MFENVQRDLQRAMRDPHKQGRLGVLSVLMHAGTQAVLAYRFAHWTLGRPFAVRLMLRPFVWFTQFVVNHVYHILIPARADIGPGLLIHHSLGGISLPLCKIGRELTVVGGGVVWDYMTVEIGDEVSLGAGMKAVGRIKVGSRVRIGPNAVIVNDVPSDSIAFGNPARVVRAGWAGIRTRKAKPQSPAPATPSPIS